AGSGGLTGSTGLAGFRGFAGFRGGVGVGGAWVAGGDVCGVCCAVAGACASEKPAPSMRANAVELTMRVFMVGSPRKAGRVDRQGHADGDLVRRAIHTGWATSLRGEQLRGLNSGSAFTKRMDVHAFFLAETPEGPWE